MTRSTPKGPSLSCSLVIFTTDAARYVELLEHQQLLLVHALQAVYRQYWTGASLPEVDGNPLVHDILDSLGLLQDDGCNSPVSFEGFHFEENTAKMQSRLSESEAGSKHGGSLDSPPALSPGSLTSQSTFFQDESLGFPTRITTPQAGGLAPFSQSPVQMQPTPAQLLPFNHAVETAKAMDATFPSAMSPKLTGDPESLGLFSAQYPYVPAFNDFSGDFMEEDSFGNFVDLGAS
ncbi:MAG: hypothetical protein INR71_10920 [Terriglobus roseus]|nr:hypothetical protein [Terriglobus roseus]